MKERIREIVDGVKAGDIAPDVATKEIAALYPKPAAAYNAAQDSTFNAFKVFLKSYIPKKS